MDDRSVAATAADRVRGLPGSLLGIAPLRAAHKAGVVDLARPIETDVVELLMTGLNQFVVKAGAGLHRAISDGQRFAANLLDLIQAHAVFDLGDQRLVAIDL